MECFCCFREYFIESENDGELSEEFWQLTEYIYSQSYEEGFERRIFYCAKCLDNMIEEQTTLNKLGIENVKFLEEQLNEPVDQELLDSIQEVDIEELERQSKEKRETLDQLNTEIEELKISER